MIFAKDPGFKYTYAVFLDDDDTTFQITGALDLDEIEERDLVYLGNIDQEKFVFDEVAIADQADISLTWAAMKTIVAFADEYVLPAFIGIRKADAPAPQIFKVPTKK